MTAASPSWPFSLNDPVRAVHFAVEPHCPHTNPATCPTETTVTASIAAYKAWVGVHPHAIPRRRLTEPEHERAWHAIDGIDWAAYPDADTVLNAVLAALNIDPPAVSAAVTAPVGAGVCDRCSTWEASPTAHPLCPSCGSEWSRTNAAEGAGA
ncbi:hypothetical protein [Streptomyces virginiae]|uniref:hypothetical protein n=1 Tax=Streptomyces virginiae TaxID=1961 RepID=UPI003443C71B